MPTTQRVCSDLPLRGNRGRMRWSKSSRSCARNIENIEKLLRVMEHELTVFDRGERPDYEVFGAIVEFFKNYPDSCHHPKEDIIYEKFKTRDPSRAASVADLEAEHRQGAVRLRRVAQAIESVLNDQDL